MTDRDRDLVRALATSVVLRVADDVVARVQQAARHSTALRRLDILARALEHHIGLMLIVAAITDLALAASTRQQGWFWLLPPLVVAGVAVLILSRHRAEPHHRD